MSGVVSESFITQIEDGIDHLIERSVPIVDTDINVHDTSVEGLAARFYSTDAVIWGTYSPGLSKFDVNAFDGESMFRHTGWSGAQHTPKSTHAFNHGPRGGSAEDARQALLARQERLALLPSPLAKLAVVSFKPLVKANQDQPQETMNYDSLSIRRMAHNIRNLKDYLAAHPEAGNSHVRAKAYTRLGDGRIALLTRGVHMNSGQKSSDYQIILTDQETGVTESFVHMADKDPAVTWRAAGFSGDKSDTEVMQRIADEAFSGKQLRSASDFRPPRARSLFRPMGARRQRAR